MSSTAHQLNPEALSDLYEALELADCLLSGANMNKRVVEKKVRGALAKAREESAGRPVPDHASGPRDIIGRDCFGRAITG